MNSFYSRFVKRILDLVISLFSLLLLLFPMMIIAVLVRMKLGSPVLFTQERIGKDEKPFIILKFRSMTNEKDRTGELLPNEERLTRFGNFLRRTSIDELPQLVNIIKGDMSVVGPRALTPDYLPYYTKRQRMRHCVRPGLTGLAAVSGRNNVDFIQRLEIDSEYVSNISAKLDAIIILKSFLTVVRGSKGVETAIEDPIAVMEKMKKQRVYSYANHD